MRRRAENTYSGEADQDYFKDEAKELMMKKSSELVKKSMRANVRSNKISNRIVPFSDVHDEFKTITFTSIEENIQVTNGSKVTAASKRAAGSLAINKEEHAMPVNSVDEQMNKSAGLHGNVVSANVPAKPPGTPSQRKKVILESLSDDIKRKQTLILSESQGVEATNPTLHEKPTQFLMEEEEQHSGDTIRADRLPVPGSNSQKQTGDQSEDDSEANILDMVAKIRVQNIPTAAYIHADHMTMKGTYLLHPQEPFMLTWQFVVGIGIMYSIVVVPFRLGFNYDASGGWYTFELVVDGFFLFDIVLNFRTAYFNDDRVLIINPRKIFWRYAKSWFLFDLTSSIPIDEIVR